MTMGNCITKATAEVSNDFEEDTIEVKFFGKDYAKLEKDTIKQRNLFSQIGRIRREVGSKEKVRVKSINNFPSDAGIAASASSFSALTSALLIVFGMKDKFDDKEELSRQIRLGGSSSAIRSVYGGFVELVVGRGHQDTVAVQIADENHWDLVDIVAVVNPERKTISSSRGHLLADTSPYFETRIKEMQKRIKQTREAIAKKDLEKLGTCIEQDSTSMHVVMMTSKPPIYYWGSGSMRIMQDLMKWRDEEGLLAYFTLDAGPNIHVICEGKDARRIRGRLNKIPEVQFTIKNKPCEGARITDGHLF